MGGKGWEKGKIKIKISISLKNRYNDYVEIEFCPNEPEKLESPLDDLRKKLENI
ncbi:MAG: KGK domain-containing protein [Cuspidothrix sp.]